VLTKATSMTPNNAAAWSSLGTAHLNLRQAEPAIAALTNAIRLQPDNPNMHVDFGVALAAGGKLDEAITQFREAIRLDATHRKAIELLELAQRQRRELPATAP
jgi:cytochrome c-type biogenesis protein CcmH/NrfG